MLRKLVNPNLSRLLRSFSTVTEDNTPTIVSSLKASEDKNDQLGEVNKIKEKPPRLDISDISKIVRPGIISSMYVNKSEILQQLIQLGVELHKIEKDPNGIKFILNLKFEDIKDQIIFLRDLGIEKENIGDIITRNPFILKESIDDLTVRINYLQSKKFTDEMIVRIISNNAFWLTHSTQDIDRKLGFFQNDFALSGDEVRLLATKCPKLITYPLKKVKLNHFVLKEEMGFNSEEIQQVILNKPKLFRMSQHKMLKSFEYLHNTMKIPLETIVNSPELLSCRENKLKERYLFLVKLGKDQFNPKQPNYVALTTLVSGTDAYFSTEVAQSSVQIYNDFLKSL